MRHFSLPSFVRLGVFFTLATVLVVIQFGCIKTGCETSDVIVDSPDGTTGENVTPLTDATFAENTRDGIVFVDFWAPWCVPCLQMTPVVEKLATDYTGKVRFYAVNVDDSLNTAKLFNVNGIPNFIILRDGRPKKSIVGVAPYEELAAELERVLAESE